MKPLAFFITALLSMAAFAASTPDEQQTPVAESTTDAETQAPSESGTLDDVEGKPAPDQLRSRELSDAFKNFRPSEEISADNAVSFPVDI